MAGRPKKPVDERKNHTVAVRLTDEQQDYIDTLINSGVVKSRSAAMQYLITKAIIFSSQN